MNGRFVKQRVFFFGMVAILAILTLILVWQFVQAILLAVAVVILLKPLYNWLLDKKWINGSERKATGLTMLIFILLIAIPAVLIVGGAITQAAMSFQQSGYHHPGFVDGRGKFLAGRRDSQASRRGISTWMTSSSPRASPK